MITIDDIKSQYLDKKLSQITGYKFNVVANEGEFLPPQRHGNTVDKYINGIFAMTGADVRRLGSGSETYLYAFDFSLRFLLPLDDRTYQETQYGNSTLLYSNVRDFRTALSSAFSGMQVISMPITENDRLVTYKGGVFVDLPMPVDMTMQMRQDIGNSIEYACSMSVAVVAGGVNTQDIVFTINNFRVPFMSISIERTPTLSADLVSTRENGSSSAYPESTALKIEFTVPALEGIGTLYNREVLNYILGITPGNKTVPVGLGILGSYFLNNSNSDVQPMIFAGAKLQGEGVNNLVYSCALVNYTPDGEIIQ